VELAKHCAVQFPLLKDVTATFNPASEMVNAMQSNAKKGLTNNIDATATYHTLC
jgi:hypothetical protein